MFLISLSPTSELFSRRSNWLQIRGGGARNIVHSTRGTEAGTAFPGQRPSGRGEGLRPGLPGRSRSQPTPRRPRDDAEVKLSPVHERTLTSGQFLTPQVQDQRSTFQDELTGKSKMVPCIYMVCKFYKALFLFICLWLLTTPPRSRRAGV